MYSRSRTAGSIFGTLMSMVFVHYFIIYPIMYFAYNYIIFTLGFPQYVIPGFWFGMLCFFFLTGIKNIFFKRS